MSLVILFSGPPGVGKDTAAEYMKSLLLQAGVREHQVVHRKFAHKLQDAVAVMGGFYEDNLSHRKLFDDRNWKETAEIQIQYGIPYDPNRTEETYLLEREEIFTVRRAMQHVGKTYRQIFGEDFWIYQLWNSIEGDECVTLVSDCRYPNERDTHCFNSAIGIWINSEILRAKWEGTHESESHYAYLQDRADYQIQNYPTSPISTLSYYHDSLKEVLQKILWRESLIPELLSDTCNHQSLVAAGLYQSPNNQEAFDGTKVF